MFLQTLKTHQLLLRDYLVDFLDKQTKKYSTQKWSKNVFTKLKIYTTSGKSFRGSMCLAVAELFQKENIDLNNYLAIASALELIHSALLIQDDIMDQDEIRRGNISLHLYYQKLAQGQKFAKTKLFGESLAICVSDVCQFLAFDLIRQSQINDKLKLKLIEAISFDINQTILAQMEDVEFAHNAKEFSAKEIIQMQIYKSARYTFALPMIAGGILADLPTNKISLLSKLGEVLGLIFQIKDDEIGIFGDSKKTGKPAGNDIRENKKTLWRYWLIKQADDKQREKLKSLFGKKKLTVADLKLIRRSIKQSGTSEKIKQQLDKLINQFNQTLELLCADNKIQKEFFKQALEFNLNRKK